MFLALSAFYAKGCKCGLTRERDGLEELLSSAVFIFGIHGIPTLEVARDINAPRAGHAVSAAGASDLLVLVYKLLEFPDKSMVF